MAERCTEHIMGTAVTIEIRDANHDTRAVREAFAWLRWVDATFSLYDPCSQISAINAGALAPADAHPLVRMILGRCAALRARTSGYFDARAADRRRVDPSGLVKGWAVDGAFERLARCGARSVCIEAGGDLRVSGGPWRVGVRHPRVRGRCAAVIAVNDGAIATSGSYERGTHVVDPHTGRAPTGVLSVTIVERTLAEADALATAAFAMGRRGPQWAAQRAAMTILDDETVVVAPRFARLRV